MNAPLTGDQCPAPGLFQADYSLDSRYTQTHGRVLLTGTQALVRLLLLQHSRDQSAGLNTAGFVSGYRGSPLGGLDQALWQAQTHLKAAHVEFKPGLNEDLAATAVWGSQQVGLFPGARVDGVFGMWYGKGPGVDRSLDVFKHANAAGTARHGGVLLVAGDDHAAKSSTLPHQSDHVLKAAMVPVLMPGNVQEIIDFGLLGYAMSRYSGAWVGMKVIADVVESTATVELSPTHPRIVLPTDYMPPADGLNIRWPDTPLAQEARLLDHKLYAALAFARANGLNRSVINPTHAHFGIVASGKAFQDTLQALQDLGLHAAACESLGLRVYKVGMVWPLDAVGIRQFATGLKEILVVEEKRQFLEYQIKEELYAWREDVRPKVYGKFDERPTQDGREGGEWSIPQGEWLLPSHGELDAAQIAKAIARRLIASGRVPAGLAQTMAQRLQHIAQRESLRPSSESIGQRQPYFCSGCPHNTSTRVPEGSRAMAGIGCHYMAVWMDRQTHTFTQMGGEGVPWIGQAPFTDTQHVFANLGDGTYFHSGILAIRASVAAGVNITYKILFNDAVAMTGGQPLDGQLSVAQLTRQLAAEGVRTIYVVSDEAEKPDLSNPADPAAPGVLQANRSQLDAVQRQLRSTPGTTALVYVQTCASEKRRRRKRMNLETGQPQFPNPARHVVIHDRVCEGCGDCSSQSNCLSIEPLATPWGTKRRINQSSCNKDYSCLQGRCPSLLTVEGDLPLPRSGAARQAVFDELFAQHLARLPAPQYLIGPQALAQPYPIVITGVGGTGVVTLAAWLSTAAHLQGCDVLGLDMAGLAQKGGAVQSHIQIAPAGFGLHTPKIPTGEALLMLCGDALTSAQHDILQLLDPAACVVANSHIAPSAAFIREHGATTPADKAMACISHALATPARQLFAHDFPAWAEQALGDTLYANPMMLGYAWQKGLLPLHEAALLKAMALNGAKVQENTVAFQLGRLAAGNLSALLGLLASSAHGHVIEAPVNTHALESPAALLQRLSEDLVRYQNSRYALGFQSRMQALLPRCRQHGLLDWWKDVARCYYRLLAFKDEFEVASHLADPAWRKQVLAAYGPKARLVMHVSPAWAGRSQKLPLGRLGLYCMRILAGFKFLRHTPFNPFAHALEFKNQQDLRQVFESCLEVMHNEESLLQHSKTFGEMVSLIDQIRGYGPVRQAAHTKYRPHIQALAEQIHNASHNDQGRDQTRQKERAETF